MAEDNLTAGVRVPSCRYDRRCKIKGEVDLISSLPDVILQHILCFIPTKLAITTCLLSRRWRYVWCDTPSLSFINGSTLNAALYYKTQDRYTAPKMMDLNIRAREIHHIPQLNSWIELAMSRNVENMSLKIVANLLDKYDIPEFFYINTSVKQLTFEFYYANMIPIRSVSWISLKKLSLRCCSLSDESLAKFLSGCPVLESLTLHLCDELRVLDLSKWLRLRTLHVVRNLSGPDPMQIVAPHIHRLILRNSQFPCTLVDVSSLRSFVVILFRCSSLLFLLL
ncbi:PREDICTED: putative F-box/LRR-repeat protein At3g18150 [Camelina sativa]|uniref:F-box/LRR-repeat protein At3g18150 n=1 Tax=Camelina sativa TaxID=90675 RepID=A0ABM0TUD5_CAMSA|nr:PREDICTED: putative F-box/LRR-repeat protein At3g18150 [Camelina sativa]